MGRDAQGVNLFASPAELRTWFGAHHERESELATLIEDCAKGRPVRQFGPRGR